ncbi:ABC transporter ATP-binding protein [Halorientalis regularis]|uniref:Cobalamin import ATP-binding protein BtuD n=1 Tax=Halorientalis regularis TaxID=660518 RepID=A0A1G7J771_9EURY|nr:ABC transporter ATP-binding protein [Halorientalis regularis]SDF20359.1 iron complex transport system ATP-binding protein [Halorientalis regularis]
MGERGFATDGGVGSILGRDDDSTADDDADDSPANASDGTGASEFSGDDLVIGYPNTDEPVIDGESIRVPPGEVTALVGPNGSGKSTLLKGLADQLSLDRGTVRVDGAAVHELGTKRLARKLGLLSQDSTAPNSITVEKLVAHGRYPHRGAFEALTDADWDAIDRAISLAGVDHLRDREVGQLSGGQQQLAWIAMALAQETDVLLLDEPTTFLDLRHQLQVMAIVERLRDESETTVVLVLHDIEQAAQYADHVVALEDGSVSARGPPEAVVTEELLADVFGVDAAVATTDHGPQVTPLRPLDDGDDGDETGGPDGERG